MEEQRGPAFLRIDPCDNIVNLLNVELKTYNIILHMKDRLDDDYEELIVDYIGLGKALDEALTEYTDRDRANNVQDVKKEIYNILKEKLSVLNEWFAHVDRAGFYAESSLKRLTAIQSGAQFVLEDQKREEG